MNKMRYFETATAQDLINVITEFRKEVNVRATQTHIITIAPGRILHSAYIFYE